MRRTRAVLVSVVLRVTAGCSSDTGEQDGENLAAEASER